MALVLNQLVKDSTKKKDENTNHNQNYYKKNKGKECEIVTLLHFFYIFTVENERLMLP